MNCGLCGRPVYDGKPVCEGCRRARNRAGARKQRRFDKEAEVKKALFDEGSVEEEDASAAWADE